MFCIGSKNKAKNKPQQRNSSLTGVRGIQKGISSLQPNVVEQKKSLSVRRIGATEATEEQKYNRKMPQRLNQNAEMSKQNSVEADETPLLPFQQRSFQSHKPRNKSLSLIRQQTAGDKVPGWHKIEETGGSDGDNDSQNHYADNISRTQESRLNSQQAAPPEEQYFNFLDSIGKEPRFSMRELTELKSHFKKGAKKIKVMVEGEDGKMKETTELVMYIQQFREQMGLLGQRQNPFLADRIFEVFDKNKDGKLKCEGFTGIMDVLCNGDEDEKNQFSFALMDIEQTGYIDFNEFYSYFSKVIAHWSSLINSHVRVDRQTLRRIFEQIDVDGDGTIVYQEYTAAIKENPDLLDWFSLLNKSSVVDASTPTPGKLEQSQRRLSRRLSQASEGRLETDPDNPFRIASFHGLQIDKDKIQKIIRMKTQKQEKEQEVNQLKQEVLTMQNHTEDQLSGLIRQISTLTDQVQTQVVKKQQEKKEWEESASRSNRLTESQGTTHQNQEFKELDRREKVLHSHLINDSDNESERNGMSNPDNNQAQQASAAHSFGRMQNRQEQQLKYGQEIPFQYQNIFNQQQQHNIQRHKTSQESQNKRSADGNSVAQSSDFHFSQFNYEFTHHQQEQDARRQKGHTLNNSKDHSSKHPGNRNVPDFEARHIQTDAGMDQECEPFQHKYEENQSSKVFTKTYKIDKQTDSNSGYHNPYQNYENSSLKNTTGRMPLGKQSFNDRSPNRQQNSNMTGALGPSASLTDILNFDFNKRYEASDSQSHSNRQFAGSFVPLAQPPTARTIAQNKLVSASPVLSVLVQLQDARETNKRNLGSRKKINIEQAVSKQTPLKSFGGGQVQPLQMKQVTDDDDGVLDPDSPSEQFYDGRFSFPLNQHLVHENKGQQLKVNLRKQIRMQQQQQVQHMYEKPDDLQSMASSHINMRPHPGAPTFQESQEKARYTPLKSQTLESNKNPLLQFHRMPEQMNDRNPYASDASPGQNYFMSGVENSVVNLPNSDRFPHEIEENKFGGRSTEPQKGRQAKFDLNRAKSVEQSRNITHQTSSHDQYTKTYRPESPTNEIELLSKLDEVNSQMAEWMKKIDAKKADLTVAQKELENIGKNKEKKMADNSFKQVKTEDDREEWLEDLEQHAKDLNLRREKGPPTQSFNTGLIKSSFGSKYQSHPEDLDYILLNRSSDRHKTNTKAHAHKPLHEVTVHKMVDNQARTFIHFGDDNWNLVLHMLFGIRQSVHSVMFDQVYQLTENEFQSKFRYELEAIAEGNSGHKVAYEFYDFSPRMFNLIRSFYGISPSDYLKSIGPEKLFGNLNMGKITSLKSQCSAGKSGSLFYYTSDGLFMLKTISHKDFIFFKKIMRHYYNHLLAYPHTLVTRFMGLHKIKFTKTNKTERIYFVIMANVFNTSKDIDVRYDLKGSTYGRRTRKKDNQIVDAKDALKDLDWLQDDRFINIKVEQRNLIIQQLRADVAFFQRMNINDYSVLLGVTKLKDGPSEGKQIIEQSSNFDLLYIEGIQDKVEEEKYNKEVEKTIQVRRSPKIDESEEEKKFSDKPDLLLHEQKRPPKAFFESQDGGLVSIDGEYIYFMGIIDILTEFGVSKNLEHIGRSIFQDKNTVSCVPPKQYGDRFNNFMQVNVFKTASQAGQDKTTEHAIQFK